MGALNDLFQALSDPTRREILRLLRPARHDRRRDRRAFPLANSTMSGHFRVLKHAGLVVTERQGTRIVYSLNTSAVDEAVAAVMDLLGTGK